MRMSTTIAEYLASRESDGYAHNTIKNDRFTLERIVHIIGDIDVANFTPQMFDRVMAHETERKLTAGSLNMYISVGRSFTKWCQSRGYMPMTLNPAQRRWRRETPKTHDYIPVGQFMPLLDASPTPRDRALMALGLFTMARQNEITRLRVKDVSLERGYISLSITKTHDADEIPISSELDAELRRWLTHYTTTMGPLDPDWYLLPGLKPIAFGKFNLAPGQPVSRPEDVVKRCLKPLGWKFASRTGMHLLRRSAARARYDELVNRGYDGALRQVQVWLHHKSVTQTEEYIGLSLDRQTRDQDTKGQPLFPSLSGVVQLGGHGEGISAAV